MIGTRIDTSWLNTKSKYQFCPTTREGVSMMGVSNRACSMGRDHSIVEDETALTTCLILVKSRGEGGAAAGGGVATDAKELLNIRLVDHHHVTGVHNLTNRLVVS